MHPGDYTASCYTTFPELLLLLQPEEEILGGGGGHFKFQKLLTAAVKQEKKKKKSSSKLCIHCTTRAFDASSYVSKAACATDHTQTVTI